MAEDSEHGSDFKYIVRLAGTDLDGEHQVSQGLTSVKGIGNRLAGIVADMAEVPRDEVLGDLSDETVADLQEALERLEDELPSWLLNRQKDYATGEDVHLVGPDIELRKRDDLNRLKKIRAYRGVRHERGQKVRGQRTRANGRTGLTVGVEKKKVQGGGDEE